MRATVPRTNISVPRHFPEMSLHATAITLPPVTGEGATLVSAFATSLQNKEVPENNGRLVSFTRPEFIKKIFLYFFAVRAHIADM